MNITDSFIKCLIAKSKNLSASAERQARRVLLDYYGVLIGGRKYIKERFPELLVYAPNDAFLKGFSAHVLELDDGHRFGMIHLGASIISALLDTAEKESLTSDHVIRGIIMGYEVAVRCACSIQPGHKLQGYHVSGTCGTIGAAMGIAFACGYNGEQIKSTLDCAVSSAAGLLEIQEQASEMKPYNLGRAVIDGEVAAQIGRLALSGPDDILGGNGGFLATFTSTPKSDYLTGFHENYYCIERIYQKIHAACRHCHPAIDATISIRNTHEFIPELVERVDVHTYKLAVASHDHIKILGMSSAKLSTPFAVALSIIKGRAGYEDYSVANLNNNDIISLTQKIHIFEDEAFTAISPAIRGAKVVIYLVNGKSFEATCLYPKGEPENPLSQEELEDKFRSLSHYGDMSFEGSSHVISELKKERFNLNRINQVLYEERNRVEHSH